VCLLHGTNWILYIILRSAHIFYLCDLFGSENEQRLFAYAALNDLFITETKCVYCAVRTRFLYIILRSADTGNLCVL